MRKKNEATEHYFSASPKSKMRLGLIRATLRDKSFEFLTASGVFSRMHVDLGTRLLAESMVLPECGNVLDVGCGYGVVGIAAAVFNRRLRVVLVDVNRRAAWLAQQNVERNCVDNAEVRCGFLYEPVGDLAFDCILSNPPVSAGMAIVKTMIAQAPVCMVNDGVFEMVVRSKIGGKRLQGFFEDAFGNVEVLARQSGYRVLIAKKC